MKTLRLEENVLNSEDLREESLQSAAGRRLISLFGCFIFDCVTVSSETCCLKATFGSLVCMVSLYRNALLCVIEEL